MKRQQGEVIICNEEIRRCELVTLKKREAKQG